jgi:hypothetical protein
LPARHDAREVRYTHAVKDLDQLFGRLAESEFRRRQQLSAKDRQYLATRGLETVLAHARDFVEKRLAPAAPPNDGKQTPWRGHPVFTAQHATATCCRGCLQKWHGIEKGVALTDEQKQYVVSVLERWLRSVEPPANSDQQP